MATRCGFGGEPLRRDLCDLHFRQHSRVNLTEQIRNPWEGLAQRMMMGGPDQLPGEDGERSGDDGGGDPKGVYGFTTTPS